MIEIILLVLALLFLGISFFIRSSVGDTKRKYKISDGKITYTDLDKPAKPLFSKRFKLVGKPDYIVETEGGKIPVELKFTDTDRPYKNHVLQLASYCLLIEDIFNTKVPYGVIVYNNKREFKILFDDGLRNELLSTLDEMRDKINTGDVRRNHDFRNKCLSCSFRDVCSFKIE